jgi:hypothetical protein
MFTSVSQRQGIERKLTAFFPKPLFFLLDPRPAFVNNHKTPGIFYR